MNFVHEAKTNKGLSIDDIFSDLNTLYSRLLCLGIQCDWIGQSKLIMENEGLNALTCFDPTTNFNGYTGSNPNQLLERMKVDLDVRTIGTLIEMEAPTAAYDVYHWGRFVKDITTSTMGDVGMTTGKYYSLQDTATHDFHPDNKVGQAFDTYFGNSKYEDLHEYRAMMGLGEFKDATPTQRRIITEASLVAITLHSYALTNMYTALEECEENIDDSTQESPWDIAVASISGWAEETEDADEGFLFMEIARFLCGEANKCNVSTNDSEINMKLMAAFDNGEGKLSKDPETLMRDCGGAKSTIEEIEKLLQAILVDVTAYFAERMRIIWPRVVSTYWYRLFFRLHPPETDTHDVISP